MSGKAEPRVRSFPVGVDDDGIRLDRWFRRHLPEVPFGMISRLARTGQLRIDGARAKPGDRLAAGQTIRLPPIEPEAKNPRRTPSRRELTEDEVDFAHSLVIHRDAAALVLDKPPGLATQGGTKTHAHVDGLLDAFAGADDPRPRLVHRLDKDTSGVLLVARTPGSAAFFSRHFSGRRARKRYWALVIGVPEISDGMIELPLAKQPGTGGEKMHVDEEGLPAKTRYRVLERAGNRAAWVELTPFTGRTHQLRAHMAAIGHPIVGDGKYGGKDSYLTGAISRKMHLHARRLAIPHPDGGQIDITAALPEHFADSMAQLGFEEAVGDLPWDDGPEPATREEKKKRARAHAKQVRKSRRGERRARGADDGPKGRTRGR